MVSRLRVMVWLLLSLLVVAWSGTALATEPCQLQPPEKFDRVVYAHQVVKPAPWIALLWVHKYYTGHGPRLLVVEYDGLWAFNRWSHDQSGRNRYLALTPTLLGNRVQFCAAVDPSTFGSGVTPYPGINPITPWALFYEAVIGYLLYRGYRWYRRRRERQINES